MTARHRQKSGKAEHRARGISTATPAASATIISH